MGELQGKVAIVTGGTAGIGRAIALKFASEGAKVIVFGTSPERGEAVAKELGEGGQFMRVDVSKTDEVDQAVKEILAQHEKIDILVNNAGITQDGLLMKMTEEQWDRVIEVNLKSAFNTCRPVSRAMMRAREGSIINVSSVVGLTGNAGQTNYVASKAGLIGFSKALALEVASRKVRVNSIAPGFIETRMTDAIPEKYRELILTKIPFGRQGRPEEIAEAALFLASDRSSYITGQVLTVDGGMVM
jgi:3-oxoacyl-[acyl-carrier protein] reductase